MIWDNDGCGHEDFPERLRDITEMFQGEVVKVFGCRGGCPEYAGFRLYATNEVLNFGIFNEGMVEELDVASTKDLVGRQYYVHVGNVEGSRRIMAVEALDFSYVPERDIDILERDEALFGL